VEDFAYLNIGEFGRGLLHVKKGKGKKDSFNSVGLRGRRVAYYVDHETLDPHIFCFVQNQEEPVELILGASQSTFGARPFFYCPGCHTPRRRLYRRNNTSYVCRNCLNLTYETSRISGAHPIIILARKHYKLIEMSEKVWRITYNGRYTRKAKRVLEYTKRFGWTKNRLKAIIPT